MYVCEHGNAKACTCLKKFSILNVNMKYNFEYSCICKYEYFNICIYTVCMYRVLAKGSCEKTLSSKTAEVMAALKDSHQRLLKWWLSAKAVLKDCHQRLPK